MKEVRSPRRASDRRRLAGYRLLAALFLFAPACAWRQPAISPGLRGVSPDDTLALSDALEELIAGGRDTPADRACAYERVRERTERTAAGNFARAAIIGRLVQQHGLTKMGLVGEIERAARRSRELEPEFRDGAATRLLGTLYVVAPAHLLAHGNSEAGLDLLEELAAKHPGVPENDLRLGEAYVALGDPESAAAVLCRCRAQEDRLRPDDKQLLRRLMSDAGLTSCP